MDKLIKIYTIKSKSFEEDSIRSTNLDSILQLAKEKILEMTGSNQHCAFKIDFKYMTQEQIDNLPEYNG